MPKNAKSEVHQDSAQKRTFNPITDGQHDKRLKDQDTTDRDVGQFTGEGQPPLQKR